MKVAVDEWPQRRPSWCPHRDCRYRLSSQDSVCLGRLPKPEPHGDDWNTHRMCLRGARDDGSWTFQLEINRGDAWTFVRLLRRLFSFGLWGR